MAGKKFKLNSLTKRQLFSPLHLLIMAAVFGAIGGYVLLKSQAANPNLPGDINNDNKVDIFDLSTLLSNYNTSNANADLNNDGTVNIFDLSILLSHYGQILQASYDSTILADAPVAYWAMNRTSVTESDLTGHGHTGTYHGGVPAAATTLNGDQAANFNGSTQYMSVPTSSAFSIPTTHQLTWETWIKASVLQFPIATSDEYVDFMGKCQDYSPTCEWMARAYSSSTPEGRCNRISAYVFNPTAGLGSAADWQPVCNLFQANNWLHVVGEYQTLTQPSGCSGPEIGGINIWVNAVQWNMASHLPTGCMSQFHVTPVANNSALNIGTMAFDSFFPGAIAKVAIYNKLLTQAQITAHFTAMTGAQPSGSCANTCTIPVPTP